MYTTVNVRAPGSQPTVGADLSPGSWPAAERARLEALEQRTYPAGARLLSGSREIVSGTLSPLAAHAGMEALRHGGTAADAAITVALTQNATDLGAVVSYAGVAALLYYDASTGHTSAMDAGWATWSGERDSAGAPGHTTLVPGFMAGMEAAHRRFGRLPFADLFQPAIWYASHGITVTPLLAYYFATEKHALARTPEGRAFLAQAGDSLPKAGDRFVQPALARTLRGVASQGARYMYEGPWARAYVETVRREGGAASMVDLERYRVLWGEPLSTHYAGATVRGPGASSVSGCAVLSALNLLEAAGGPKLGPYWSDPTSFALETRIDRLVSTASWNAALIALERERGFASDCAGRLTTEWASAVLPRMADLSGDDGSAGHHSDAIVVVDRWGNVAALVHSINSPIWGETGMVVGGIPIGSPAGVNKARIATLAPGARVPSDMAPVIAFRNDRPVTAVAAIGVSIVPETVRVMAGLLDGRSPSELAAAPPMLWNFAALTSGLPLGQQPALVPSGVYSDTFTKGVEATGLTLTETPAAQVAALRGTAAFVLIDSTTFSSAEAPGVLVFGEAR